MSYRRQNRDSKMIPRSGDRRYATLLNRVSNEPRFRCIFQLYTSQL